MIPVYLIKFLEARSEIKVLASPYSFPEYSVKQHWHARCPNNPNNQWLRKIFLELFSESCEK